MSKPLELLAASYADRERAASVLAMLQRMHDSTNITLVDAAVVTKDEAGKVHIQETREVSGRKGALRGALVTGVLGVIYPPSLLGSALVGGAAGGLWGRLRDTGIKTAQLQEITEALSPSHAAVVALVEAASAPLVARNMAGADGQLLRQPLEDAAAEAIEQAGEATITERSEPDASG